MNAGALLAIPPIVEVFFKGSLTFEQAVVPMVLFLVGLIAAVLTSYAAYFNFQYLAQSYSVELWRCVIDLDEKADLATFHRLKRWRAATRADYDKQERRYDLLSGICFYVANILGVASLGCFVSGALLFASSAIPSD